MHGIYPENVGVNARLFKDEDSFFDYLDHSAIFAAERDGQTYYFYPIQAEIIWRHLKSKHLILMGMRFLFTLKRKTLKLIVVTSTRT